MIKNGQRRRTPGGVFLQLLRELATSNTEPTIDPKKASNAWFKFQRNYLCNIDVFLQVKKFFAASVASCQKPQRQSRPKMPSRDQNVKGPYNPKVLNPKITIVLFPFWLLETSSYLVQILHKITYSKMKLFKKTSQTMVETKVFINIIYILIKSEESIELINLFIFCFSMVEAFNLSLQHSRGFLKNKIFQRIPNLEHQSESISLNAHIIKLIYLIFKLFGTPFNG